MSFFEHLQDIPWGTYAARAVTVILVWAAVWVLVRYLTRWITKLDQRIRRFDIEPREMKVLDRVLDYAIILIGAIITFSILGISELLYSALTAAGVISIIIGFAVKDVAANFISGIFILMDQPFVMGDFIAIGSYSGTVSKISLRSTQLATFDGPIVSIPNSKMATDPTTNYSVAAMRLVEIKISVPKDADLAQAIQLLRDVAASESRLMPDQEVSILVTDIGQYAVDLLLRCFAPNADWIQVRSDLHRRVVEESQRQGVELAVPVYKNL